MNVVPTAVDFAPTRREERRSRSDLCQTAADHAPRAPNPDPLSLYQLDLRPAGILHERKSHGAISIWDRNPASLKIDDGRARDADPNVNIIIREPGHVEYAASLGLGVADLSKIKIQELTV